MNSSWKVYLSLWAALIGNIGLAETAPVEAESLRQNFAWARQVSAFLELRPSWISDTGRWYSENTIELGYRFSPRVSLSYMQFVNTNMYSPGPSTPGLDPYLSDGAFRLKMNDIWISEDTKTTFSYEFRPLLPTFAPKAEAGMLTTVRNYFKLKHRLSSWFTMAVAEVPMVHVFSHAGYQGAANPLFENMFVWMPEFEISSRLTLSMPVFYHLTRFSNYAAGATNSGSWTHTLWFWPDLIYALTPNWSVGLSYYSDNLLGSDLSGFNISQGLRRGVFQAVVQATL